MVISSHRNIVIAIVVLLSIVLFFHSQSEYLKENVSELLDKAQDSWEDYGDEVDAGDHNDNLLKAPKGFGDPIPTPEKPVKDEIKAGKKPKKEKPKKKKKPLKDDGSKTKSQDSKTSADEKPTEDKPTKENNKVFDTNFYDIGAKFGTDKVLGHTYHNMYTKYLEPMRNKPLKFLEIGLGCDMSYGPGASYNTWLEYFPNVELYYIEYDAACAAKWADSTSGATIYAGDQANRTFLEEVIKLSGGQFDVIVDDGGHTMVQQKTSFDVLFPEVKPAGLYFIEDLATSGLDGYGGGQHATGTTVQYIEQGIAAIAMGHEKTGSFANVVGLDCMLEVCAFTKAGADGQPQYPYVGPI